MWNSNVIFSLSDKGVIIKWYRAHALRADYTTTVVAPAHYQLVGRREIRLD